MLVASCKLVEVKLLAVGPNNINFLAVLVGEGHVAVNIQALKERETGLLILQQPNLFFTG